MSQILVSARTDGPNKRKPFELILRGHGMMALAHIGVLKALEASDMKPEKITGLSLGALLAVLYANGWSSSAMLELFLDQDRLQFVNEAWLGAGKCWQPEHEPASDLLPVARQFVAAHNLLPCSALRIVCFDVAGKDTVVYGGTDYDLATALAASCAVAGIMRPIRIGRKVLVDCALNGCTVGDACDHVLVSNARCEEDLKEIKLSKVDGWLNRRRLSMRTTAIAAHAEARITIDTVMPVSALGSCGCSEETVAAIVQAGCDATLLKIAELGGLMENDQTKLGEPAE